MKWLRTAVVVPLVISFIALAQQTQDLPEKEK